MINSTKWFFAALALAPAGTLFIGRLVLDKPGPSAAHASEESRAIDLVPLKDFPQQEGQASLVDVWQDMSLPITHPTPFYQSRVIEPMRMDDPIMVEQEPEADPEPPSIALTAVMGGRRPIAVVEGRMITVGQEIADGWFVSKIDTASQSIEIATIDGEVISVEVGSHLR